jgi:hypothetical protein
VKTAGHQAFPGVFTRKNPVKIKLNFEDVISVHLVFELARRVLLRRVKQSGHIPKSEKTIA